MTEHLPLILGLLLVVAFVRIFWSSISRLGSTNDKYEIERRRIERRKKELGIEDDPVEVKEPAGSGFLKGTLEVVFGFLFGLLAIYIGIYFYMNG